MQQVQETTVLKRSAGIRKSIGAILVDAGRLSTASAEQIYRLQREQGSRFGDAAVKLGLLSEEDIRYALAYQFDYPYLPPGSESLGHELIAAYRPNANVVEQLRALRSQIMLRWLDNDSRHKMLAVVSAGGGEGRSFIAANLAVVFSQLGERTLLIDADLRNPRLHEVFKLSNKAGLSEVISGRATTNCIVRIPNLLDLSVLPAGAEPPNPQELLGRPAFKEMLDTFRTRYDIIILDSPAGSEYADAQTIAARTGVAIIVAPHTCYAAQQHGCPLPAISSNTASQSSDPFSTAPEFHATTHESKNRSPSRARHRPCQHAANGWKYSVSDGAPNSSIAPEYGYGYA